MIRFDNSYENNLAVRLKTAYDHHAAVKLSDDNQWVKDRMIWIDLVSLWHLTQDRCLATK